MDVSDIFYFFFCSGAGEKEEASEEVAGGSILIKIEGGGGGSEEESWEEEGRRGNVCREGGVLNIFFRGRNAHQGAVTSLNGGAQFYTPPPPSP